jgi:hypothetical protein
MPMRFKNAKKIFQRFMDTVLGDEIGKSCMIYVDYILIYGVTEKNHDEALERILSLLKQKKLEINKEKSLYKRREIRFLGHLLSKNAVIPNILKVQATDCVDRPKGKKALRSFLGLINYYRKFIPNCSNIAGPLYNVTKRASNLKWTKIEEEAFLNLKKI